MSRRVEKTFVGERHGGLSAASWPAATTAATSGGGEGRS